MTASLCRKQLECQGGGEEVELTVSRLWGTQQAPVGQKLLAAESLDLGLPGNAEGQRCVPFGSATGRFMDRRVSELRSSCWHEV